jgi:hypothetical protein
MQEMNTIEDFQADFDEMVSRRNYTDARALIDNMGDLGYETEATILHRALNLAEGHDLNEQEDLEIGETDWRERADDNIF